VVEETVGGAVQRKYTYGLQLISENQFASNTWTPSFYGQDGSGSVRQLTNASQTVTDTYEYDAFGNKINSTGTTSNNYLYRGEQYDPDLGLYYLRARYYNPVTGRFLNVDPMAGDGQRRYQYAAADPVDGMDPTGNFNLEMYRPLWNPLLIHFPSLPWCSNGSSGLFGSFLPPCEPPCPKCFAQLKFRIVDDDFARKAGMTHSFWYVQDRSGNKSIVSGFPTGGCKTTRFGSCKLNPTISALKDAGVDKPTAGTWWDSGYSERVCSGVDSLMAAAKAFPRDKMPYWMIGPNSNTFAHYLGNMAGWGLYPRIILGPPGTIGWGSPLPFLP
jgi:RHS repeat-associated protein